MAEGQSRAQRILLIAFLVTVAVFGVVIAIAVVAWGTNSYGGLILGGAILGGYMLTLRFARSAVVLLRPRDSLEPTAWMRRGGLMASPEASARPDETRINAVLGTLPADFPAQDRNAVEAYLAMVDDDEKQLYRDKLIKEFYELAGSDKLDYNDRRAYNALRLALSPWSDSSSDT